MAQQANTITITKQRRRRKDTVWILQRRAEQAAVAGEVNVCITTKPTWRSPASEGGKSTHETTTKKLKPADRQTDALPGTHTHSPISLANPSIQQASPIPDQRAIPLPSRTAQHQQQQQQQQEANTGPCRPTETRHGRHVRHEEWTNPHTKKNNKP